MRILVIGPSPTRSKGGMATVIEEIAKDKGWIVTDDNCHYCPNCWHYDDNGNIVTGDY